MNRFISSNPGLQSRFTRYLKFDDYLPEEMLAIFEKMCNSNQYMVASDASSKLLEKFADLYQNRDASFGNGRLVRNIFEKTLEKQAVRLSKINNLSKEIMMEITADDIF